MSETPRKSKSGDLTGAARGRDRHVVSHGNKWAVKKAGANRASSIHATQAEALQAARDKVRAKGGEVRVQGRDGRWRASFTVGRDPFEKIGAVEGITIPGMMKKDLRDLDRQSLTADERRRIILDKYGGKRLR